MNQAVVQKTGYEVTFSGGSNYPEETLRRAKPMLQALLDESAAPIGDYLFNITGPYPQFEKLAVAHLEVGLGAKETAVLVMLRSRGGTGGSICGSLYVPAGVDRSRLFNDMKITADNFNKGGGWAGVLQNLPPGPSPRSTEPTLTVESLRGAGQNPAFWRPNNSKAPSVSGSPSPSILPPQPSLIRLVEEAVPEPEKETTMPAPAITGFDKKAKLAQFLQNVVKGTADSNGVFSGKKIIAFSKPLFPDEVRVRWLGQGILFELEHLEWIRHVGIGQYQVQPAFVVEYGLGLTIDPLPRIPRGPRTVVQKIPSDKSSGASDLEALFRQKEELETRIRLEVRARQQELIRTIEEAKRAVLRAQQQVVADEAALAAHNEQYAELLKSAPPSAPSAVS